MTGAQLVILAAGMGRRFGGLKQLVPVGPGGAAIMDYTVFDALHAGFDEVLLMVRSEIEAEIRAHVEDGIARRVAVRYVRQEMGDAPAGRTRPWGTGHAVLGAAPVLRGPFAVANADDFYGRDALARLGAFLAEPATSPPTWAMVAYRVGDTLPETGTVSRGILQSAGGYLEAIEEVHGVRRDGDGACRDRSGRAEPLPASTLVSMNLWGFDAAILDHLRRGFAAFRAAAPADDDEYYLPTAVGEAVARGGARVRVLDTTSRWCGLTSADDLAAVRQWIDAEVAAGTYPAALWD